MALCSVSINRGSGLLSLTVIVALCHIVAASSNEASASVSTESVYRKVRYRVRDIVAMLHSMQENVSKDGVDDAELFGKYQFYCRKGRKSMEAAIEDAENVDLDGLKSTIEGEEEQRDQIEHRRELDQGKKKEADKAMAKAKQLRQYEAAVYGQESDKLNQDIATLKHGVSDIEKGKNMEQPVISLLKEYSGCMDISDSERARIQAFLKTLKFTAEDAIPKSEEVDLLQHLVKVLNKRMAALKTEEKLEKATFQEYKDMVKAKANKAKADIDQKDEEIEEIDTEVKHEKETLEDAARYLMEGPAFLPFITDSENCSKREEEWADRCTLRTSEMAAIAGTITILTDEDLLDELMHKSLPKPWQEETHHAIAAAKRANQSKKDESKFDGIISLAGKGKNASVEKISKLIDGMVALLAKEKPNTKQEKYCGQSLNQTQDNLKTLTLTVSDLGMIITQHEKSIQTLEAEIKQVHMGIEKLDQSIVDAAEVRRKEHEENAESLTSDSMTMLLFRDAYKNLGAFYEPEVTLAESTNGVTLGEIIGQYQKKHDESKAVMALLDSSLEELRADLEKMEAKEDKDQNDWEIVVKESLDKHANDMKSITIKEETKTQLQANLVIVDTEKVDKLQEVKAASKYLSELQGNHTGDGFLQASVCSRKIQPDPALLKRNFMLW